MPHLYFLDDALRQIKPQRIHGYALANGWHRDPAINGNIVVFNHPSAEFDQLIVPVDERQIDYTRRLRDILRNLAEFEARPELEVLNDLLPSEAGDRVQ